MKENKIEKRICKYTFSENEKKQIASELANGVADIQRLEDQKKSIMSQLKSEIDSKQADVNLKAEHLRSGFEMRSVDCEVIFDYAEKLIKWERADNFEIVHTRKMTPEELQMKIEEYQEV